MFTNPECFKNIYRCKRKLAMFLIEKRYLPLFGLKNEWYYFRNTVYLQEGLKAVPFWIKMINWWESKKK
jgi:hypothetical protein